jgi:class 3 adenylate cyclase
MSRPQSRWHNSARAGNLCADEEGGVGLAPKTEFVLRGDGHLAYQVFGDGPASVLNVNGYATHREQMWQFPFAVRAQEWVASFARMAAYDLRGYGMSDALPTGGYPIEEFAADAIAVLDAAELPRAAVWGDGPGGAVAIWLAVHYPDRVAGLVLDNASACRRRRAGYDIGMTDSEVAERRAAFPSMWGTGATITWVGAQFAADERMRQDWARYERVTATPNRFVAIYDAVIELDVRDLLAAVRVPTLVVHSATNTMIPASHGKYLTEHIAGARYLEVDQDVVAEWENEIYAGAVAEFLTGSRAYAHVERSLQVVVFVDIVASTDRVAALGDAAWRGLLDDFRATVRTILDRYDGREVNTRGDDFFIVVSRPSIAVAIAQEIRSDAQSLGLQVRGGIHLGEVEHQGDDYTGLTVHIGARIAALAAPGEILMSRTVRDALAGTAVSTTKRGTHHLKGVPDDWTVYAIES